MNYKLISISDDFFQSPFFRVISNATPALVTIAPNLSDRPNYTPIYKKYLQDNPTPETPIRFLKQWLGQYLSSMPATTGGPRISPTLIDEVVRSISEDQVKKLSAIVHVMENEKFPNSIKFSFLINIIGGRAITDSHHNGNYQCGRTLGPVANQTINDAWDSINFIPGIDPTNIGLILSDISQRISDFPEVLLSQAMESGHFENGEAVGRGEAFKTWSREVLKRQFITPKDTLPPVKVSDEFSADSFKKFSEWAIPQMEHAALNIILASVRYYLALNFVKAMKTDTELKESDFYIPETVSTETATKVAEFINRYAKQGDIHGYDPELVSWTPGQHIDFETLIPLKIAYAYAIEQKLLTPNLELPQSNDAIDDWIKAQLQASPYYLSISTINEAVEEIIKIDPGSLPCLRGQLIKQLAEIKPRDVALAVIANTKEPLDDEIIFQKIMSVHQELDSLRHTLQNGSLAEFYQSLDESKFSSILVMLVNGPLHFEESTIKRLEALRETMKRKETPWGWVSTPLETLQYLGEDFVLAQLKGSLDRIKRFRDIAPKLSEYSSHSFLPATLHEIHMYFHERFEQRQQTTIDQNGLTERYFLAKKYALLAYFDNKKTVHKSLSYLPALTLGYPDGIKVACHQICTLNSPESLDAFFKAFPVDLVVKPLEEILNSLKISPSLFSIDDPQLTWTNCVWLFKAVCEQAKTNLVQFRPIIEKLMKTMSLYFQNNLRSDESIRLEIKKKDMTDAIGMSYFKDVLKNLDDMTRDMQDLYQALHTLDQDLADQFKSISTASHKKVQSPKALDTTLSTGQKIEGPQHQSLNNLGYKGTWMEITTPAPLKGATLNYPISPETVGEKMNWNATHIHTFKNQLVLASQAPYGEYFVSAFLTLLIKHNIQHIIALATPEEENGYTPYIPTTIDLDHPLKFPGDFSVTLQSQKETKGYTVNTIEITSPLGTHTLTQHLYPHWPNQGFPDQANILPFVRYVHKTAFSKGPTLVHCNAGIGRTGSLLALAWIVENGQKMHPSEVDTLLDTLNNERPGPQKDAQKKAIKVFASKWHE